MMISIQGKRGEGDSRKGERDMIDIRGDEERRGMKGNISSACDKNRFPMEQHLPL